jgi:hypothetical protein
MKTEKLVSLKRLSTHYELDMTFFYRLIELDLIEIHKIENDEFVHQDLIGEVERMIRMHVELEINPEGIDTIFNLLDKIDRLEDELNEIKNKLRFYEDS